MQLNPWAVWEAPPQRPGGPEGAGAGAEKLGQAQVAGRPARHLTRGVSGRPGARMGGEVGAREEQPAYMHVA